jgi:hypothetical protein
MQVKSRESWGGLGVRTGVEGLGRTGNQGEPRVKAGVGNLGASQRPHASREFEANRESERELGIWGRVGWESKVRGKLGVPSESQASRANQESGQESGVQG